LFLTSRDKQPGPRSAIKHQSAPLSLSTIPLGLPLSLLDVFIRKQATAPQAGLELRSSSMVSVPPMVAMNPGHRDMLRLH
jgi:hypothetical protein